MKAHVIHKSDGTIESVVFESGEIEGSLELSLDESDDEVTTVDLSDALPGDLTAGTSGEELSKLGLELTKGYRLDKGKKKLTPR